MTSFQIFSTENSHAIPWPDSEDGIYARNYLAPFLQNGAETYIRNIHQTQIQVVVIDETIFPVTLTQYHPDNAYTCSPYNHYISYGGYEELHRLNNPPLEKVIRGLIYPIAAYFRHCHFDRVAYVNNWLLSTNLYPQLNESVITALADHLPQIYPDRPIVFRSVDPYRNPLLFNTLQSRGFKMVLSRQVWYMDPRESMRSHQLKEDQRVLRRHPYQIVTGQELNDQDLQRTLDLYNQLYITKYSSYNPRFTLQFFKLARDQNLLHFRALRLNGKIDGIMGFFIRSGLMTQPVFGYDTTLPQETGLYRLLTLVTLQEGLQRGLVVHASAGVGKFKKIRAGKSTIEYHAVYDRHLPAGSQIPWLLMKWIADRAVPIFEKNDFKPQELTMQLDIPIKIAGIGRYLPERIVKNPELEALCGLSAGWIEERNGVRERRWVTTETNSVMGAQAAREAVQDANIPLTEIDLILNASGTAEQAIPDTSALIQRELGMGKSGVACMTLHTTCLSFVVALDTCASLIASGRYKNILVVTSDITSVGINPKEPESATLVGDAATAVVITRANEGEKSLLHNALLRTYGDGAYYTAVMGGGTRLHPNKPGARPEDNLFHMDGLSALRMVNKYIYSFLDELYPGLSKSARDLDAIVPHQASKLGLMLLTRFGWPENKIMRTLDWMGNCVAASIPATLYEGIRSGSIQRGSKVLLIGTSAGLSIGGVILTY